jgi:hypothetical protein
MSLPIPRSRRGAIAGVAAAMALIGVFYRYARPVEGAQRPARIAVQAAHTDGAHGVPVAVPKPSTALTVTVDTTQVMPADLSALASALAGTPLAQTVPNPDPNKPDPNKAASDKAGQPIAQDWLLWGHLDAHRVQVVLNAPVTFVPNALGLYAAASTEGRTVCLVNRSQEKLQTRVQVRLPRGIYTIERLTLLPADRGETALAVPAVDRNGPPAPRTADDASALGPAPAFRLERLQGRDLRRAAVVVKSGMVEPGQVVFYRFTDQSRAVDAAYAETYRLLAALEHSHPGPAHRLRRMLREGDSFRSGARPGGHGGAGERLENIHRLLLVTAQAQSLHHNYQMRRTVEAEIGAALMGSLERVMDGLAEISATLLDLVPQISVEPDSAKSIAGKDGVVSMTVGGVARIQIVTVALANGGEHSVEMVKLGLDSSELPTTVNCDPSDPAFFGTLNPGQTVRATFRLRCPSGVAFVGRGCVADVCYRAGGGPAHLRPRPW